MILQCLLLVWIVILNHLGLYIVSKRPISLNASQFTHNPVQKLAPLQHLFLPRGNLIRPPTARDPLIIHALELPLIGRIPGDEPDLVVLAVRLAAHGCGGTVTHDLPIVRVMACLKRTASFILESETRREGLSKWQ